MVLKCLRAHSMYAVDVERSITETDNVEERRLIVLTHIQCVFVHGSVPLSYERIRHRLGSIRLELLVLEL